eukprot:7835204-Heterocapsa_arctica.AAC.1
MARRLRSAAISLGGPVPELDFSRGDQAVHKGRGVAALCTKGPVHRGRLRGSCSTREFRRQPAQWHLASPGLRPGPALARAREGVLPVAATILQAQLRPQGGRCAIA